MTARPPHHPTSRVLVAYDGTPSARRALERAADEYRDGELLAVINVADIAATSTAGSTHRGDHQRRELDDARRYLAERGIDAETIAVGGEPGTAICGIARERGFDRIVVGSRNLSGAARLLLGSISDRVAQHAHCDVLIAR